jgi:hypothetical protein
MKGIAWIIVAILLMIVLSVLLALFAFGKKIILEKRLYQEKILSTGNRIEATGNLMIQSANLATIQALYDIGHSNVAVENDLRYNDKEKLPYWSEEYEDYIKQAILKLAEKYFENYNKSFTDYFMDPSISNERYKYWHLKWEKDMKIEKFDENYISLNFGQFNITYNDETMTISKKYPLVSKVNTKFLKTIQKSKQALEMIENKEDLNSIESSLSDNEISLSLKSETDYIVVSSKERSTRKFYLFSSKNQGYGNLGVIFVFDKKKCFCVLSDCSNPCWWGISGPYECPSTSCGENRVGVSLNDLKDIKKCWNFYILSSRDHSCDIFK